MSSTEVETRQYPLSEEEQRNRKTNHPLLDGKTDAEIDELLRTTTLYPSNQEAYKKLFPNGNMRALPPDGWFAHEDLVNTGVEHDVDCRPGAAWASRHKPFASGFVKTKPEAIKLSFNCVMKDPSAIVVELVHWATGYSYKVWKVLEENEKFMTFHRGGGDHALVYSMGKFRCMNKINKACAPLS